MKLFSTIFDLLKETYYDISEFGIGLHGAAIAFYAIFSTAPLVTIFVWLLSVFLGTQMGEAEFQKTLQSIVGPELNDSILQVVESTSRSPAGFWSSVVAIIALLFGATTLLSQIKQTLNKIWGLKDIKIGSIWSFLWDRLTGLLFVGVLSILFIGGLIFESVIYGLENILVPIFKRKLFLLQILSSLTNVLFAVAFFGALFKILPDIEIRWRDVAVGAIVTTFLVLSGKTLVDLYLSTLTLHTAYKAAGSFVIFLIWIYYNVQVVLIGAIFTKVFTRRFGGEVHPYWDAEME